MPLRNAESLLLAVRALQARLRDDVVAACRTRDAESLSGVSGDEGGDTIYAIDRIAEGTLRTAFADLAREWPLVLVAEGLGATGRVVLPDGTPEEKAELRVLCDPIDGTRGLMYGKRSAWVLTGVAPNRGAATTLQDIELAVQTEIPPVKQTLADVLWAIAGRGAYGERVDLPSGTSTPLALRPSTAGGIEQGFGGLSRFFPGARALLSEIDDAVVQRLLGPGRAGRALTFEDQYISNGGQLYELMMGHDRWIADVRPLCNPALVKAGRPPLLCSHPYDMASELIAREAGVIITTPAGAPLSAPFDVETDVAWFGFANPALARKVGAALRDELRLRQML